MSSIPKRQILLIRSDELVAGVVRRAAAPAQLVVPEAVERAAVRVVGAVVVDGL